MSNFISLIYKILTSKVFFVRWLILESRQMGPNKFLMNNN